MDPSTMQLARGVSLMFALPALFMGLAWCFLGYPLFRISCALNGLGMGVALGMKLACWARTTPSGADLLIACGLLAIVLAALCWLFWRLLLALQMASLAGMIAAIICGLP